jgi:hypothetical protein
MDTEQRAELETLDIEDLEYDVGGAGAVESSDTQVNHGANLIVRFYRAPN